MPDDSVFALWNWPDSVRGTPDRLHANSQSKLGLFSISYLQSHINTIAVRHGLMRVLFRL
jgi:hypothetical protein